MRKSQRYRDLVESLCELRNCFLPEEFDPLGNYDDEALLKTSAYIVLAHAEIESFIEDRVEEAALAALKSWKEHRTATSVLIGLVGRYAKNDESNKIKINENDNRNRSIGISWLIDHSITAFHSEINENHGIRESNLNKMLIPIGIRLDSFDQAWIINMENFGKGRGEIAHKSRRKYTTKTQIDPRDEFRKVNRLLHDGLKKLDFLTEELITKTSIKDSELLLRDFYIDVPENEISDAMSRMFSL